MNIGLALKIKYGLVREPSEERIAQWTRATELYLPQMSSEEAGRRAAQEVFPDYDQMVYKAEADTVLALLEQAKNRPGPRGE